VSEPTLFSYRTLEQIEAAGMPAVLQELAEIWQEDCRFARVTLVSDDYPNEPYPHGLYFEGWETVPAEQPPFNYPLMAV
jgi:hypothetical protein